MYDPRAVLQAVDGHRWAVIALCAMAMVPTYIWFIEAIRVARRDRAYSMPLLCTFFWFAHDTSFVARYDLWFHTYDHWYLKMFWAMLVLTVGIELVYIAQMLRFGRDELFPGYSQGVYTAVMLAGLAGSLVVWEVLKQALNDDLYIVAFSLTVVVYPPMGWALLLRRGSRLGQSVLMWVAFLGLPVGWFLATSLYFGPPFRSWQWIALGLTATTWGVFTTVLVHRAPASAVDRQPRVPVAIAEPTPVAGIPVLATRGEGPNVR